MAHERRELEMGSLEAPKRWSTIPATQPSKDFSLDGCSQRSGLDPVGIRHLWQAHAAEGMPTVGSIPLDLIWFFSG